MKPLRAALENYDNIPYEGNVDVIYAREDKKPKFVYMYDGMCLQIPLLTYCYHSLPP